MTVAVPPNAMDLEAAVLSGILLDGAVALDRVEPILRPEHFYADQNRRVYEAIIAIRNSGKPVDVALVAQHLRDANRLDQIGGTSYLAQLADATPASANIATHAQVVREKWRLRQTILIGKRLVAEGGQVPEDAQAFIDSAEREIFALAQAPERNNLQTLKFAIERALKILNDAEKRGGAVTGIASGFTRLDRQMSGLHPGDLYILAARPGIGKTACALNVAINVASQDDGANGVLFCSLEMPKEQLAARALASDARVDMSNIRGALLSRENWTMITESAIRLSRYPFWIDDSPGMSLSELRSKARSIKADQEREKKKLALVVIDYLQLMRGRSGAGSREQEVSELSRGLKEIAKELGVPVMALSQLNRAVETRNAKNKRPQLSDLRESGAIEQDADTIIFIYRDEYYNPDSEAKGVAELIVAKQRNGPTGTVLARFTSAYTRFDNLEAEELGVDQFDDFADFGVPA